MQCADCKESIGKKLVKYSESIGWRLIFRDKEYSTLCKDCFEAYLEDRNLELLYKEDEDAT